MAKKPRKNPGMDRSLSVMVDNVGPGMWNVSTLDYPLGEDADGDVLDGPWDDSFDTKREAVSFARRAAKEDVAAGLFAEASINVDGDWLVTYKPSTSKKVRKNPGMDRSLSVMVDHMEEIDSWNVSSLDYPVGDEDDGDVDDGPINGSFDFEEEALEFAELHADALVRAGEYANATILVDGSEHEYISGKKPKKPKKPKKASKASKKRGKAAIRKNGRS